MGVINHNAVVATTFSKGNLDKMMEWIKTIEVEKSHGGLDLKSLFVFGCGIVNDYHTMILLPDGSKEGWPESKLGDSLRAMFVEKLNSLAYEDGSNPWSWVEVSFGEYGQTIVGGNNTMRY